MVRARLVAVPTLGLLTCAVCLSAVSALRRVPSTEHRLTVAGRTRTYLEYIPRTHPGHPALVMVLHGGGGTARGIERWSGFDAESNRHGFIVVYPQGENRAWADGRGRTPSDRAGVNDVEFLSRVIGEVERRTHADRNRVLIAGISNGGFMAARLACDRADLVSVIAPVAATMGTATAHNCRPVRPVSVMEVAGTEDPLVPYSGGQMHGRGGTSTVLSAPAVRALWATVDRCRGQTIRHLPTRVADGTAVTVRSAASCAGHAAVQLWTVVGGGHTWPGGPQYLPRFLIGRVTHQFRLADVAWRFLVARS